MTRSVPWLFASIALGFLASVSAAHFNMLLPEIASAKREQEVTFLYQWGHPFEHQLFAAPMPQSLAAVFPDGKKIDLSLTLEKIMQPNVAYRFRFKPEQRGDYIFLTASP